MLIMEDNLETIQFQNMKKKNLEIQQKVQNNLEIKLKQLNL